MGNCFGTHEWFYGRSFRLALLIGFLYLLVRKVIKPIIPIVIIVTVVLFSGILYWVDPTQYADRFFIC